MSKSSKAVRLTVNVMYRNGVALFSDETFLADCELAPAQAETPNTRVVTLRFAAPSAKAEALAAAFHTGDAELNIEAVRPLDTCV